VPAEVRDRRLTMKTKAQLPTFEPAHFHFKFDDADDVKDFVETLLAWGAVDIEIDGHCLTLVTQADLAA
jgi:hypothetical protein